MNEFELGFGDDELTPRRDVGRPNGLLVIVIAAFAWLWWSGNQHDSGPQPPDDPHQIIDDKTTPTPAPIREAWLLFVYESEDNDANFLSVFENKPYRDSLTTRGLQPYFQDVDAVPPEFQKQAKTLGLPACFVIDKKTDELNVSFSLPAGGPTSLDDELRKRVGK